MNDAERTLVRINRAGLRRFRYVNGNAATYLELLRQQFQAQFPHWDDIQPSGSAAETSAERNRRLENQYAGPRGDLAWEIARAFARASHVLTEYVNAYANEKYLGTATQAASLENLLAMLNYRRAPPASATTDLVLLAKADQRGTVEEGLQVQFSPPGGGTVVFETLRSVEVDAALNTLRPRDHDRNPALLAGRRLLLEGEVGGLRSGEPIVLEREAARERLEAYLIAGVRRVELNGEVATEVTVNHDLPDGFPRGHTVVHSRPIDRLETRGPSAGLAFSEQALVLTQAPGATDLPAGAVVVIDDGLAQRYRVVARVEGKELFLSEGVEGGLEDFPPAGARVGRPVAVAVRPEPSTAAPSVVLAAGDWSYLTGKQVAQKPAGDEPPATIYRVERAVYTPITCSDAGDAAQPSAGYTQLELDRPLQDPRELLVPPRAAGPWHVDTLLQVGDAGIVTEPPTQTSDDDLAAVMAGQSLAWARLRSVVASPDNSTATLEPRSGWQTRGEGPFVLTATRVYGRFTQQSRLQGWQENTTPIHGATLLLDALPVALRQGQAIVAQCSDGLGCALRTEVADYHPSPSGLPGVPPDAAVLVLADPLPAGYTHANTLIHANVAPAGHGETRPERILGNGNAVLVHQRFLLMVADVAFVSDAAMPSGLRADVEVRVDDEIWRQVATLDDSSPTDPRYRVCLTEAGVLAVEFGDGRNGRRLPTGVNNVRIRYRQGSGLAGNAAPGSLETLVRPHPLLDAVRQPLRAAGGHGAEDIASLRRAPARVLTLRRAVSLADFARLAEGYSGVHEARAVALVPGFQQRETVGIVVIPAGELEVRDLARPLKAFIERSVGPGVQVRILPYQSLPIGIQARVAIDSRRFAPAAVLAAVRRALLAALSRDRRRLGQPLFRGDVYRIVEGVAGVRHSECRILRPAAASGASSSVVVTGDDGTVSAIKATARQIIHLDARAPEITVRAEEGPP